MVEFDWAHNRQKFGLSMVPALGGKGVYIDTVKRDSAAGGCPHLRPGVFIDSVNGISVAQGTLQDVASVISAAEMFTTGSPKVQVKMGVVYDPAGYHRVLTERDRERSKLGGEKKAEKMIKADMAYPRDSAFAELCRKVSERAPQQKTTFVQLELTQKLGLQLIESSTGEGVYLDGTLPGSAAAASKRLQAGLRFTKVNKTDVRTFKRDDLVKLLATCKSNVTLEMAKDSIGYARAMTFQKMTTDIPGCAELFEQSPFFVRCVLPTAVFVQHGGCCSH